MILEAACKIRDFPACVASWQRTKMIHRALPCISVMAPWSGTRSHCRFIEYLHDLDLLEPNQVDNGSG